ncbi:MAG: hypothetical protein NVS4B9_00390 [Ktedonobacteraceae bacterium]
MNFKSVVTIVTIFVVAGVLLGFFFLGPSLFTGASSSSSPVGTQTPGNDVSTGTKSDNAIARENDQTGTSAWRIPDGRAANTEIQAFAGATSVLPGKSITFYVSTKEPGTHYVAYVYRMGWYGGAGGRLMATSPDLVGQAQGYYDQKNYQLVNCTTCTLNPIDTNWKPSYTLSVPGDWTTGIYLAKFIDKNGMQTYAPFDVLGGSKSAYVAVTPDTTYAAYNYWGKFSLYVEDGPSTDTVHKDAKVSFNKPYADHYGASQVTAFILQTVRWMEKSGYDVSYMSDVDLHVNSASLLTHKAFLSLGHDEYWTKQMRQGVEAARNKGVGIAFLGANAVYWQMRFEPDRNGVPNRVIVCYKVEIAHNDYTRDPMYGVDNSVLTSYFRDPAVKDPENSLLGAMWSGLTHAQSGFPWRVDPSAANLPLLKNTGLQSGVSYGCGIVGYEWDKVWPAIAATDNQGFVSNPVKNVHILSTSYVKSSDTGQDDVSNSTYYIAPSGAMVFDSGTIRWSAALDSYRPDPDKICDASHNNKAVPEMQLLMANIMDALIVKHNPNSF